MQKMLTAFRRLRKQPKDRWATVTRVEAGQVVAFLRVPVTEVPAAIKRTPAGSQVHVHFEEVAQ
jgi:hypothetical protein